MFVDPKLSLSYQHISKQHRLIRQIYTAIQAHTHTYLHMATLWNEIKLNDKLTHYKTTYKTLMIRANDDAAAAAAAVNAAKADVCQSAYNKSQARMLLVNM